MHTISIALTAYGEVSVTPGAMVRCDLHLYVDPASHRSAQLSTLHTYADQHGHEGCFGLNLHVPFTGCPQVLLVDRLPNHLEQGAVIPRAVQPLWKDSRRRATTAQSHVELGAHLVPLKADARTKREDGAHKALVEEPRRL